MREIIVDSFAGGGGASTGIEMALGVSPDIAINHDAVALNLHAANHPATTHLPHSIWKVDPLSVCAGRPVGLLWASPDCKHFSKAKGGKPVEKSIRDLAWVVVRWARQVSPRVIILENVEEFQTWGPLADDGRPCPDRKGATFKRWIGELRRLGYRVEFRELRACDYGVPTIRKRLFLIARRDGEAIIWPKPTHAPASVSEDGIVTSWAKGHGLTLADLQGLKPYRTAAEIIDWSQPCPSIFDTSEQIKAMYGLRAVRPLQPATLARIAKGIKRYVLDAAKPFIIRTDHSSAKHAGVHDIGEPARTVTSSGGLAVAQPFVMPITHTRDGERGQDIDTPLHTITAAHRGEHALVAPYLARTAHGDVDRNGKRRGQGAHALTEPHGTVTASGDHAVVAPFLTKFRANSVGSALDEPAPTVTANSFIKRPGGAAPLGIVAPRLHLVAAFLAQHNISRGDGINPGREATEPVSTILQSGSHQGIVAANLSHQYGSGGGEGDPLKPARAVTADGQHHAMVASFLTKYYGTGDGQEAADPLHTVTTKDRLGLVTVMIEGEPYVITDIGMRMLTPRELFRAQGFPESYIIDRGADGAAITKTDQVSKCGNSVCPPMAAALVAANFAPRDIATDDAPDGFFLEAAE